MLYRMPSHAQVDCSGWSCTTPPKLGRAASEHATLAYNHMTCTRQNHILSCFALIERPLMRKGGHPHVALTPSSMVDQRRSRQLQQGLRASCAHVFVNCTLTRAPLGRTFQHIQEHKLHHPAVASQPASIHGQETTRQCTCVDVRRELPSPHPPVSHIPSWSSSEHPKRPESGLQTPLPPGTLCVRCQPARDHVPNLHDDTECHTKSIDSSPLQPPPPMVPC